VLPVTETGLGYSAARWKACLKSTGDIKRNYTCTLALLSDSRVDSRRERQVQVSLAIEQITLRVMRDREVINSTTYICRHEIARGE